MCREQEHVRFDMYSLLRPDKLRRVNSEWALQASVLRLIHGQWIAWAFMEVGLHCVSADKPVDTTVYTGNGECSRTITGYHFTKTHFTRNPNRVPSSYLVKYCRNPHLKMLHAGMILMLVVVVIWGTGGGNPSVGWCFLINRHESWRGATTI